MSDLDHETRRKVLLKYDELDTFAMVVIIGAWKK
jgi:hypothetical protein